MNELTPSEKQFWNDSDIVRYFGDKPADPRVVSRVQALLAIRPANEQKALDVGCGAGRHTKLLADFGFDVYACDVNPAMLEATQALVPHVASHIVPASITELPFASDEFAVVVSTGVMHQVTSIADYAKAAGEIARVLEPGGLFAMNVFTSRTLDPALVQIHHFEPVFQTAEGLPMTLLTSAEVVELLEHHGLLLDGTPIEEEKMENTGVRTVFRACFLKRHV